MITRRNFLKNVTLLTAAGFISTSTLAKNLYSRVLVTANDFKQKIIQIILTLKDEGSDLVKKIMNGREYIFDPYTHYPYDGGIKDPTTGCQLFFHAHRPNEYGHFHTFVTDSNGELIHLILISMNDKGEPIGLAAVNRWVTDDKFVKADVLKKFAESFYVDPALYKDKRVVEFINYIFKSYPDEINNLFDQRDKWIRDYVNKNFNEPFEDRDYEVLSFTEINILDDDKTNW
jgi:hypothetical protein